MVKAQVLLSPSSPVRPPAASRRWRCAGRATGGVIINADSAQIYRDLPILSAAPSRRRRGPRRASALRRSATAPSPARRPTGRRWPRRRSTRLHADGRLPILVGGTGLYLRTLLDGIAPVPPIDPAIRAEVRARRRRGESARRSTALDPVAAATLNPGDTTRIARALEVVRSTGRTLGRVAGAARRRDRRARSSFAR